MSAMCCNKLFTRRQMYKFFCCLSLKARWNNPRNRLAVVLMFEVALIATVFMVLYFKAEKRIAPIQKTYRTMQNMNTDWMYDYLFWKTKFIASSKLGEVKAAQAYRNMLKNSENTRRILKIIEEESINAGYSNDRPCVLVEPDCPLHPPNLKGKLDVRNWIIQERKRKLREDSNFTYSSYAGIWSPSHCTARHSVAIIIPYRNRTHQLQMLLQHLPPILQRQEINYSIFVVEQVGETTFNKGVLMNAGFLIALSRPAHDVQYHCFVFHDVDLLAEDDRNLYTCPEFPRHMSSAVDQLDYILPYYELVGGVFSIRTEHFIKLNGYSNLYWGWGGEDDDMGLRVGKAFKTIKRPVEELGRFTTIPHIKQKPIFSTLMRQNLKRTTTNRYLTDGLSAVKFQLEKIVQKQQFTHIFIDVGAPPKDLRPMINPGLSHLKRTMMQQLIERLENRSPKRSNWSVEDVPPGALPV